MSNEELVKKYASGDTLALTELTEKNLNLIRFVAKKFSVQCNFIDFDDLIQEGWTGFYRAVQTYKPDLPNSAKFSTWAIYWVYQSIQRFLEQKTPKSKEISIYEEYSEDLTLLDTLEDTEAEYKFWSYIERNELREELEDVMEKYLPLKQRQIIKLYYGWDGLRWRTTAIAKLFNIRQQSVSAQHKDIIRRLRKTAWGYKRLKDHYTEIKSNLSYKNPIASATLTAMKIIDD